MKILQLDLNQLNLQELKAYLILAQKSLNFTNQEQYTKNYQQQAQPPVPHQPQHQQQQQPTPLPELPILPEPQKPKRKGLFNFKA